jgi:hypothetical protein
VFQVSVAMEASRLTPSPDSPPGKLPLPRGPLPSPKIRSQGGAACAERLETAADARPPTFRLAPLPARRSGEIDPFELSDEIHRFHDGVSRELYNLYGNAPPRQSVPRALARILQETDVPPELLAALESTVQFFRDFKTEPAEPDED